MIRENLLHETSLFFSFIAHCGKMCVTLAKSRDTPPVPCNTNIVKHQTKCVKNKSSVSFRVADGHGAQSRTEKLFVLE